MENKIETDKDRELCLAAVKDASPSWSVRLISGSQRKIRYRHPFSSLGPPVKPMDWQSASISSTALNAFSLWANGSLLEC